jgi:hypothetical protein
MAWPLSWPDTALGALVLVALVGEISRWYDATYRCTAAAAFADGCWYTFPSLWFVVGTVAGLVLGFRLFVDSLAG